VLPGPRGSGADRREWLWRNQGEMHIETTQGD